MKRAKKFFILSESSSTVFMTLFTWLVNSTPVFAYACGQIPILKNLAKFVAFSLSLSAAVENRYVQPIEQEQTVNGITAKIEYVIVSQKQLNIIYSLDSKIYHAMDVTTSILFIGECIEKRKWMAFNLYREKV